MNVVSRDAPLTPETRASIEAGDFSRLRAGLSTGARVDNLGYFLDVNTRNLSGLRDESVNDRDQVSAKLSYQLSDATRVSTRLEYLDEYKVERAELTKKALETDPTQAGRLSTSTDLAQSSLSFKLENLLESGQFDFALVRREKETVGESRFRDPQDENDLGYSSELMYRHDFNQANLIVAKIIIAAFGMYNSMFKGNPRDLNGEEYTDITIQIRKGKFLRGEADPKFIAITWSDNTLFGYASWKTLLVHELFHLWSAESIRYADNKEQWFNEGIAEFYAFKTAGKLGFISPEESLASAAMAVGYYSSAQGLGKVSIRSATKSDQSKMDNYFLIYTGGWVIAMVLDHDIRKKQLTSIALMI